ncbi:YncE family protein [Pseudomonas reactans]|uniref:YncE family protein n=1 Tax=Pseudomonas reactans TaxID=117680 RepID=UPI0015A46420|nr:YncE family protein [Pseudomonas reactans]NWA67252.1 YncE family protein [Pseudomonas reactans]
MSLETDLTDAEQPSQPTARMCSPAHNSEDEDIDLSAPTHLNRSYFAPPQPGLGALTPRDFINTRLADLPIYIPGLTQNVQSHDGGINKAALDVHQEDGLLCNLLPYFGMAADDFCQLFWGDLLIPVAIYNVTQDDVDNERLIALYVPRARIIDGSVNPVFIRVDPFTGNAQKTAHFNLKVDTVLPGGRNPVASTLQNENLPKPMFEQRIIDFGVTETDAQNGVPVNLGFYPVDTTQDARTFRAARDRIRLSVGGVFADIPPITEGQAAGRDPIVVVLYYGFWQQVGSGSHLCEYEVRDEVGNHSDGWSPAQLLNVELNDGVEPLLPEPFFEEAPEDILDHDELEGQDATIVVAINRQGYNVGDVIRVTVNGRSVGGTAIVTTYDSAPLTSITIRQITLPCPNADLRKLIGGRLQLSYVRIRSGVPDRKCDSIIVDVIGTPIEIGLPPPIIIEAISNVLDPQLLTVNVEVPVYDGRDPFDLVTLILDGTYANGKRYYKEIDRTAGTGSIRFRLANGPDGDIAKLEGGTLRFLYRVTNADGIRLSRDETVQVGSPSATLPEPQVLEAPAPAYQFDPEVSLDDATIIVPSNAGFRPGDTVILHCEGTAPGGTQPAIHFPIQDFWVGRDLPFTLERRYITPNLNQSMRIYYEHRPASAPARLSIAVNMKVGSRLALPAPTVLEATVIGHNRASLNPQHVLPPRPPVVNIRVVVDGFPAGADIKLFITGKSGVGMPDIPAKPARPEPGTNYVTFVASNIFVAAYLGEQCSVFYNLIEFGQSRVSDRLTLEVEALPPQLLDLVSIPEASGGVIDADSANRVEIKAWPFFRPGQLVWIFLDCVVDLQLRAAGPVTLAEFNAGRTLDQIPPEYLRQLNNGGSLTVKASVSLDGTGDEATMVHFTWITYGVRKGSGEIIDHINVGNGPTAIAISPNGNSAYTVNSRGGSVSVITLDNNAVSTFTHRTTLEKLAVHPTLPKLYFTALASGQTFTLPILDLTSFSWSYPFTFGVDAKAICLNPTGSRLIIGARNYANSDALYVYDTISNIGYISTFKGTHSPNDALVNPKGTAVFSTGNSTERFLYSNQTRTHAQSNGGNALGLAHSPLNARNERLYVAVSSANKVIIFDTANNNLAVLKTLTGLFEPIAIVFHPFLPLAYVTERANNSVRVIDTDKEEVIAIIQGFDLPHGIAITPNGQLLLVCNSGNKTVAVVSI